MKIMKKFVATFWRYNPQLAYGGYFTTREITARTLDSARKKAASIESSCLYGSMSLINLEEVNE